MLLSIHAYNAIETVPFHNDEVSWFFHTQFFEQLFLKKSVSGPFWYSYESYDHPQLSKYIFGGYSYLRNRSVFSVRDSLEASYGRWFFYFNPKFSGIAGSLFEKHILIMREMNAMAMIGALFFAYRICSIVSQRRTVSILLPIFLGTNDYFLRMMIRATSDAHMILFSLFACYLIVSRIYKKNWLGSVVLGVTIGCAMSSKLTGILILFVYIVYEGSIFIIEHTIWKKMIKRMSLVLVVFFGTWIINNPTLFVNPFYNTYMYFEFRIRQSIILQEYFTGVALPTIQSKIASTICTLWNNTCAQENGNMTGNVWLSSVWSVLSLGILFWETKKGNKRTLLVLVVFYIVMMVNTAYLPLNSDRYFLFPFVVMVIVNIIGLIDGVSFLLNGIFPQKTLHNARFLVAKDNFGQKFLCKKI